MFWQDDGVPSIGLRPYTVFGPLRDQGLTSQPTLSIEAAVRGEPYHIEYGGTATYQFAPDVALQFIMAAREGGEGAGVYTLGGDTVSVGDFVSIVHEVTGGSDITIGGGRLPFPGRGDDGPLLARFGVVPHTPLREAIVATEARNIRPPKSWLKHVKSPVGDPSLRGPCATSFTRPDEWSSVAK